VAEQFGFKQISGYGATIDGHNRVVSSTGVVMYVPRNNFFAGAGFSLDKYICIALGNLANFLAYSLHWSASANQATKKHIRFFH
jgi:hypothetical protein